MKKRIDSLAIISFLNLDAPNNIGFKIYKAKIYRTIRTKRHIYDIMADVNVLSQ